MHRDGTDAARIARELYGLVGELVPLAGERDENFRLTTPEGERFVLKLHHEGSDPCELALQDAALAHIGDRAPAPRVLGTPGGQVVETPAGRRTVRLLSWIEGRPWAEFEPTPERLAGLGRHVAALDRALADFRHEAMARPLLWNLTAAPEAAKLAPAVSAELRPLVGAVFARYADFVAPRLEALPHQVVHNDANEHNVLVDDRGAVAGLIDFGDVVWSARVCGLAVACAYALLGAEDPVRFVLPLVRGYDEVGPLAPAELEVLFDLIRTRLAVSACMAAHQHARSPGNDYLLVSQRGVADALRCLATVDADLAHFRLRDAVGFEANPAARSVRAFLASGRARPVSVLEADVSGARAVTLDMTGSAFDATDPGQLAAETAAIEQRVREAGAAFAIGRYGEQREIYRAPQFTGERRTLHLGCDLFLAAGAGVRCALPGTVAAATYNPLPLDYGGLVIVEHRTDEDVPFWTLYGHLDPESLPAPGARLEAGDPVGRLGEAALNGGWPPHLHLQLLTHLAGMGTHVYGVAPAAESDLWLSISPDPNLLLGRREGVAARPPRDRAWIAARRRTNLSRALSLSYDDPLRIVRGDGAHLYDEQGRAWLDLVNNVCHVGHCHPRVVAAGQRQMAQLDTNTRYLHDSIAEYARRLVELLPDPLRVCFFVNSGSEANDLALRLAQAHTGARDVLVLDHAYHGHLGSQVALSPYKFDRAGGAGRPDTTHVCELPDPYRGRLRAGRDGDLAQGYAGSVAERLDALERPPAAFFAESLQGCGGQIVYPDGYLAAAFALVRERGGVCVADEVQVGLGRVGSHVWGFELQGVVPDVVTMGKPIGNGHPLAAVVTTPEVARSFAGGMEYFNTFGGNPVSAEIGLAVLDVMRDEGLQAHAARRGAQLVAGLCELQSRHPLIGDVRGAGLFLGVELSLAGRAPATAEARAVKEAMKERGVLISTDGPDDNVLKIKPPMVLTAGDCDHALDALDAALSLGPG